MSSENKPSGSEMIARNAFAVQEENAAQKLSQLPDVVQNLPGIKNVVDNKGGVFYGIGSVTRKLSNTEDSLPLRAKRAEAYHKAKKIRESGTPSQRKEFITSDAKDELKRKDLTKELYDHTTSVVVTSEYGELGGEVSILNHELTDQPPLVFIPGSSNDPESVESFAVEMALQLKRRVIVIGYPDAPNGKTTQQFTEAVVGGYQRAKSKSETSGQPVAPSYEPYTKYFEQQIQKFVPDGDFYLAGYSAGGAISAKLLNGEGEINKRVLNAVFFNPAGSADFSDRSFQMGGVRQSLWSLVDGRKFPQTTWVEDPRDKKTNDDKFNKVSSWKALYGGVNMKIPDWETIRVKDNGKIVVFSGERDYLTRSFDTFSPDRPSVNPTITVVSDKKAHHNTVGTYSKEVINSVTAVLPQLKRSEA